MEKNDYKGILIFLFFIVQVTYVGDGFTRKPPKYERFIRPTGLRMKKAHVTHPELKVWKSTFQKENFIDDLLFGYFGCEEESTEQVVHGIGCHYQGFHY